MTTTQVPARLHWTGWLTQDRLAALPGSRQGFTARLLDGGPDVTFSIVLTFPAAATAAGGATDAELELLLPGAVADVARELTPGRRLAVFSGPREVATCEILAART